MLTKDGLYLKPIILLIMGLLTGVLTNAQSKAVQNNSTQPAYFIPNKGQFKDSKPYLYFVQSHLSKINFKPP